MEDKAQKKINKRLQKTKKIGDKRIHNDDFEQVEKCFQCHKLFWARSMWELGNWESECRICAKKRKNEQRKKDEFIKANGKAIYGGSGQIFAWTMGEETFVNPLYEPTKEEEIKWANGFIAIDKFEKNGNK